MRQVAELSKLSLALRNLTLWLCLLIFFASVIVIWRNHPPLAADDAWITYRYARNLAEGKGFVYNEAEFVLGTSTPLWTLLLALLHTLGLPIPESAAILGLLFSSGTGVLAFLVARHWGLGTPFAFLGALIIAVDPLYSTWGTNGMEAPLYAFWLCWLFGPGGWSGSF